jgi:hypothetical protein
MTFEQKLKFIFQILDYDQDSILTISDLSIFIQQLSRTKLVVGDRIRIRADGRSGLVRYWGETKFATGIWVGVELDDESGKHDGTVKGVKYFQCKMKHGVFVPSTAVVLVS